MRSALAALDRVMAERGLPQQRLVVVGGSYLALEGLRESTRDVDTVTRLDEQLRPAIAEVGAELGLDAAWLNDSSVAFRPAGLADDDCGIAFEGTALVVLVPSPDWIFLMKLNAGRFVDRPDMVRLWRLTGFASPQAAVDRYWDAYPAAADDQFLVTYVNEIANEAR